MGSNELRTPYVLESYSQDNDDSKLVTGWVIQIQLYFDGLLNEENAVCVS